MAEVASASRSAISSITARTCSPTPPPTPCSRPCIPSSTPASCTRRSRRRREPPRGEVRIVTSAGKGSTSRCRAPARPTRCAPRSAPGSGPDGERAVGRVATSVRPVQAVHLGDLTWNKEIDRMCPSNRLGARGRVRGVASWPADLEQRSPCARAAAASGVAEQRHAQGRSAAMGFCTPRPGSKTCRCTSQLSGQGAHCAGDVHRQRDRRAVDGDADRGLTPPPPGPAPPLRRTTARRTG